ncbi:DnaD domain protein [Lysinibacillus sphaericus]|uniref:DnaD domain protein n=2 Tax=Lysinibacillus sphaericus TaxID=1421 RepID=A0A544U9Z3_LYSSH|nr:DnaD domain protein [Lysinibacillus sp. SDF0037]
MSEELVIRARKQAIENNVLRWNYVEKILQVWTTKKFTTIEEVEADKLRFVARKQQQRTYNPIDKCKKRLSLIGFINAMDISVI